jgi:probable phosphoglycerate mutase
MKKRLQQVKFEKVFTSPRKRALVTCEGFNAIVDPLIAEWDYGDYEGLTSKEISQKNPSWNLFLDGAPGGERPEQVGRRADQFLQKLHSFKGNVALFSHGHFLRVLAARYLGLDIEDGKLFLLSVASIGILGFERKQPVVVLWNDTHHLDSQGN